MAIVVAKPVNKKGQTSKVKRVYLDIDGKTVSCKFTEKLIKSNLGENRVKSVFETNDVKVLAALKKLGYSIIDAAVEEIKDPVKTPAKLDGVDGGSGGEAVELSKEELLAKYEELFNKKAPSNMLVKTLIKKIDEFEAAKE